MAFSARVRKMLRGELSQIQVASPCHARWEEMEGDEKVRFCCNGGRWNRRRHRGLGERRIGNEREQQRLQCEKGGRHCTNAAGRRAL